MRIVHISDLHFGPYHWNSAYDQMLLDRINAFNPDLVLNTGDMTTDSLTEEFQQAEVFLKQIACRNVVSIMGNHDKFSWGSADSFRKYIYDGDFVEPKDRSKVKKIRVYADPDIVRLNDYLYDLNFIRSFDINGEEVMVVALDTCLMHHHDGRVEEEILNALSDVIKATPHDRIFMVTHHPVLSTDDLALQNSKRVSDFIGDNKIEANFCGHTHEVDIADLSDRLRQHTSRHFMCGSSGSRTLTRDVNMFLTIENFGAKDEAVTITRMFPEQDTLRFEDTLVPSLP